MVELCFAGDNVESESCLSHLAMTKCKELFNLFLSVFFFLKNDCENRCFDMMLSF